MDEPPEMHEVILGRGLSIERLFAVEDRTIARSRLLFRKTSVSIGET